MIFEMIGPAVARTKVERAIAAGGRPVQPDEVQQRRVDQGDPAPPRAALAGALGTYACRSADFPA